MAFGGLVVAKTRELQSLAERGSSSGRHSTQGLVIIFTAIAFRIV
jgi:hypothetical protein